MSTHTANSELRSTAKQSHFLAPRCGSWAAWQQHLYVPVMKKDTTLSCEPHPLLHWTSHAVTLKLPKCALVRKGAWLQPGAACTTL